VSGKAVFTARGFTSRLTFLTGNARRPDYARHMERPHSERRPAFQLCLLSVILISLPLSLKLILAMIAEMM